MEGKRLIQDAMNSGFYPKTFVFSRVNQIVDFEFDKSKELDMYQIPYRSVELWSELPVGHPGFMGEKILDFYNNDGSVNLTWFSGSGKFH